MNCSGSETDGKSHNNAEKLLKVFPFELESKKYNENLIYQSSVPEICTNEAVAVGVDEAGRGPVLGPMVYAVAYCPISKLDELADMGFADSKTLTEAERDGLFLDIYDKGAGWIGWAMNALHPTYISSSMLRKEKYNLNALAHDTTIALLKALLASKVNVQEIYVDTVGPPESYQAKLSSIFPNIRIRVSKKADSLFPIVSAASICAKVPRDQLLRRWKFTEGNFVSKKFAQFEFGSGYPSDEKTTNWLRKVLDPVFGFPSITRFSWGTAEKMLDSHGSRVVWRNPASDQETVPVQKNKVTKYFAAKPTITKKRKAASATAAAEPEGDSSMFIIRNLYSIVPSETF